VTENNTDNSVLMIMASVKQNAQRLTVAWTMNATPSYQTLPNRKLKPHLFPQYFDHNLRPLWRFSDFADAVHDETYLLSYSCSYTAGAALELSRSYSKGQIPLCYPAR